MKPKEKLRYVRLVPLGHYERDSEDREQAKPLIVAAPTVAAAEAFVIYHHFYECLDPAYDVLQRQFVRGYGKPPKPHVLLDRRGEVVGDDLGVHSMRQILREAYLTHAVLAKGPNNQWVRVLNPGDCGGRTWLFWFRPHAEEEYKPIVVEANSPEHAMALFDSHPLSYGVRLNPYLEEAKAYGTFFPAGEVVPHTDGRIRFGASSWLTYAGTIITDPKKVRIFSTPDTAPSGRLWLNDCWKIDGVEGREQPYETDYKLPNGTIVNPLQFAKPPNCTICKHEAREHLTDGSTPGEIYCSQNCRNRATAEYMLLVPGIGKRLASRALGPVHGWTKAKAAVEKVCASRKDLDEEDVSLLITGPIPV